jgi:hypothetical protein
MPLIGLASRGTFLPAALASQILVTKVRLWALRVAETEPLLQAGPVARQLVSSLLRRSNDSLRALSVQSRRIPLTRPCVLLMKAQRDLTMARNAEVRCRGNTGPAMARRALEEATKAEEIAAKFGFLSDVAVAQTLCVNAAALMHQMDVSDRQCAQLRGKMEAAGLMLESQGRGWCESPGL